MRRVLRDMGGQPAGDRPRGFTLVELLVVILIIGLVSVVALAAVLPALGHRQVSEAGRILQGALVGARDKAIHDNQPCGVRLMPDPAFPLAWANGQIDLTKPLAYNRIIPVESAPEYNEGFASIYPTGTYPAIVTTVNGYAGCPCLVLEECVLNPATTPPAPNSPTSWLWNVRLGDKIQIGGAGPWYTVVGPMFIGPANGNTEMFVNIGPPGTPLPGASGSPLPPLRGPQPCEFLLLVNGRDDNGNGWIDEGFDGIDNNLLGGADEHLPNQTGTVSWTLQQWTPGTLVSAGPPPVYGQPLTGTFSAPFTEQLPSAALQGPTPPFQPAFTEWEAEAWQGGAANGGTQLAYSIRRRPVPSANIREIALPTAMVIDPARSQLPVNSFDGTVDILINPDGTAYPSLPYGAPSAQGMAAAWFHLGLVSRTDVGTGNPPLEDWSVLSLNARTGRTVVTDNPPAASPFAAAQQGAQ